MVAIKEHLPIHAEPKSMLPAKQDLVEDRPEEKLDDYELYRSQLGEIKFLTREEEKILGRKIEAGKLAASFLGFLSTDGIGSIPIIGSRIVTEYTCREIGIAGDVRFVFDIPKKSKESKLSKNKQERQPDSETVTLIEITNPQAVREKLQSPEVQEYLGFLTQQQEEAKQTFTEKNLFLPISIAKNHIGRGVAFLDLIQEGNIGLMKAVDKYQWWRGNAFSTYATWWIRQAMQRFIHNNGRTIRYPVEVQEDLEKLGDVEKEHLETNGILPTEEELSKLTGIPLKRIHYISEINEILERVGSLDVGVGDDRFDEEGSRVGDFVADQGANTERQAEENILRQQVKDILDDLEKRKVLTEREKKVLIRYHGLDGQGGRNYNEIGEEIYRSFEIARRDAVSARKKLAGDPRMRELAEAV